MEIIVPALSISQVCARVKQRNIREHAYLFPGQSEWEKVVYTGRFHKGSPLSQWLAGLPSLGFSWNSWFNWLPAFHFYQEIPELTWNHEIGTLQILPCAFRLNLGKVFLFSGIQFSQLYNEGKLEGDLFL